MIPSEEFAAFADPTDGQRWQVDVGFLASSWRCIWDAGCKGIEAEANPAAQLGCCSVGAELLDEDEAMGIAALAATLDPATFQFAGHAERHGVFRDEAKTNTAVVDGACVFLNRPGFSGGEGCALHLGALADNDPDPLSWRPAICWQLPLKVETSDDGTQTLRRWRRADWGPEGETMAWCCTEEPEPYTAQLPAPKTEVPKPAVPKAAVSETPVAITMAAELEALVGPDVAQSIQNFVGG